MSNEVKKTFINRVRTRLDEFCFPAQMEKILDTVESCLFGFDIDVVDSSAAVHIGEDFLQMFLNSQKLQGHSEHTISNYQYILSDLITDAEVGANLITPNHIRTYIAHKKESGLQDSTLERYRAIFNSFFNWLFREGLITKNPMANIGAIKVAKKLKKSFTDTDVELMRANVRHPRDIAIILFLLATACRVSEIVSLNIDDIDFRNRECKIHGKGNKERKVYLDESSILFLKEYILKRDDDNPALFVSIRKPHDRIKPAAIQHMLKKLGMDADVDHVHPHKFRRTKTTNLIKHGMPIHEVASILGHDMLNTTMAYIAMDDNTLRYDYNKFS